MINAFWYKSNNFGDQLTPDVLEFVLGEKVNLAKREDTGKLLGIGSIMTAIRNNDVVWGSGAIRLAPIKRPTGTKFLAVRGPLTLMMLTQEKTESVPFGDPAILLPLMYKPEIKKRYKTGYLPHYIDVPFMMSKFAQEDKIGKKSDDIIMNIEAPWHDVVDKLLSCERIVTSSLHGIIVSEAYGIPVIWEKYSDKIIGGDFKFQDYFLGTGRQRQVYGEITDKYSSEQLLNQQNTLIQVLKNYYGKK